MMNERIENYLRGILLEENDQQIWKNKPKGILNIFVSSTFTDTHTERNILHEEILPKLIEKGFENEIQITLYDMRFGVKDENTIDHMTWEICREGIQQCYEESDGLFFLSLQSDKYGYCPLPKYLPKDLIDIWLTKASSESGFDLFHEWYQVDTNSTPATYNLKNLTDANTNLFYEIVLPSLRDGCLDSFPFTNLSSNELFLSRSPSQNNGQQLLVNRSVTEWETLFAMSLDAQKCCWVHRDFPSSSLKEFSSDISLSKDLKLFEFCDYQGIPSKEEKINLLKTQMKTRITDAITLPIHVRSYIEGVRNLAENDARDEYDQYIDQWRITTLHRLNQEIHKLIQRRTEWKSQFYRGLSVPLPQQYLEEFLHHNHNAMKKVKNFFGRSNILQQAIMSIIGWTGKNQLSTERPDSNSRRIEMSESGSERSFSLSSDSRHKTPGNNEHANNLQSSVALALVGQSGTGKTALLAKLFTSVMQHLDYFIPTIIRFCGTSQYSMTGISLIQSISIQILLVYRKYDLLTNFMMRLSSLTYDQSIREFHQLLEEYPIYLFIDSLDSLSNKNEARSRLRFLLHIPKLNPHSRIIVSTLPDPPTGKIFYQCETRLRETNTPILLVNSLDQSETFETYQQLLAKQSRGLTAAQWDTLMTSTLVEPTILYLNLAIEIVRKWRSFDDPTDLSLSSTVKGIIHQIFTKMERDYGRQLVSWAFAFITFSRDGMNDQEIRDSLSKQSLVCQEVFQYSQMGQRAFPMHVWLRVKLAIRSLLLEQQEGHGTRWYHRQLWETAEERYNSVRTESHLILAHYFQAQPRVLNKDASIWSSTARINRRRIREAYYHWLKLIEFQIPIDYPKLIEEVCCLEMLYASAVLDDLFSVAIALEELLSALPATLPLSLSQRVNDYSVYLKAEASSITMKPFVSLTITASAEPSSSSVYQDFLRTIQHDLALSHHLRINGKDLSLHPLQRDHVWCQVLSGNSQEGNPWEMNLSSHEFGVRSASWSPDDTKVVSGAFDDLIKIWDAKTGQVLMTLEGHDEEVASVCWHPVANSSLIASGAWDNVVMIWNTKTGELVQTLDGHSDCVSCVVWNHDGKLLATASRDSTIKIWDTRLSLSSLDDDDDDDNSDIEFTELFTLSGGHTSEILCAAWNNQGSLIASGGEDKNIVLWDLASRLVVSRLVGHEESVQAISWHPVDSNLLASCSFDRSIRIWNISTSSIIRLIEEAHSNRVTCIRWNPVDGYRLASTSYDMTIKVWDYNNGQLLTTLEGHTEEVYCVNWNFDGTRLISGSEDNNIKVWSCPEQRNQSDNRKGSSEILSVGFSCTGEYLAAANKQMITIWEGQTGEVRGMIQEESKCLDWHPTRSSWLATGSSKENALCIWDVHTLLSDQNTQVPIIRLLGHSRPISICHWHPTGNCIATGSWDESAKIWFIDAQNPSRSTMIISLDGHKWRVFSLSWNCTGSLLATASVDGIIYIWKPKLVERKDNPDNSSSAFVVGLTGHSDSVFALDWHPSNPTMLASGSDDHTIRIWDIFQSASSSPFITIVCDRFDEIKCLRWHFHRIKEVYSIIAGSWNHCIKIFDFPTGNLVMVLDGYHTECINSIQLSKDEKRLVSGSHDKSVKVFYLE